ncbi:MAG TPA: leucyl aminopeptidase [Corynebacterium sp.]|nr:leucyl aminopeptidase [Corynebacterium sp.]
MAKNTFDLPARGTVSEVMLSRKAPRRADALLIGLFSGEASPELPAHEIFDDASLRTVYEGLSAVGATGKANEITRVPAPTTLKVDQVVAVGLGSPEDLDDEVMRRAAATAARALKKEEVVVTTLGDQALGAAVEGLILGSYAFTGLRSESEEDEPKQQTVHLLADARDKDVKEEFTVAQITADSVVFARDLVNTPSSHLYPEVYAELLAAEGTKNGLKVEVLDEKDLARKGFGGMLAVGQGSARSPRLVRLTWAPRRAATTVALVGKGITFDTGGISLKPPAKMENMISDMGGSAAMAGAVIAAARLNLPVEVTATLPLAENMPSGTATRPGDVITHYGGLTSEIINTDAEGRIVLADAIARASEDKPDYLIEASTLTGAQLVALGARTSAVMGSEEFRDSIAATGRRVGENAWAMPLLEEHEEEIKSPVADIRNSHNSRNGGMLFAGTYLAKFVGEDIEWAHIDIAGPSWNESGATGYTPKRATGAPVRTVVAVLRELAGGKK